MNKAGNQVPERLREFFIEHNKVALAFSGGSDSAYLLYAAVECSADVRAYYVRSEFQPEFETEDAMRLAAQLGLELTMLPVSALSDEQVRSNPENRCYFCKQNIFGAILRRAEQDGYHCVIDGTNASDDVNDRPGMKALIEMQVLSPLRICGITKAQQRQLSQKAGLFTWNKPAYACLATRIPTGTKIRSSMLRSVEKSETELAAMGFTDFRVRITEGGARIEVPEEQMEQIILRRKEIMERLQDDFREITLNLNPRKGS